MNSRGEHHYDAVITRVVDGDTVDARVEIGHGFGFTATLDVRFRLTGFDAPETYRPKSADEKAAGLLATAHLESLVYNRPVVIHSDKHGKYRYLATIYTTDGVNINEAMVRAGHVKP